MTLFETSGNFALVYADAAPQLAHPPGTNVLFVSAFTLGEKRGSALVPVAANKPFSVVGVDASTGLQSFAKLYDVNLAPGGPIGSPALPSPVDNAAGPYPVVVDRTYRSRTLGSSPMGIGWDSSLFTRLRELPSGDVELRDGSGELWLFRLVSGAAA